MLCSYKPGSSRNCQQPSRNQKQEDCSSVGGHREYGLDDISIAAWDAVQNHEITNFCCFKPPVHGTLYQGPLLPSDFAAGRDTLLEEALLEQRFYNVSVP